MALTPRLDLRQTQALVMTPQLQQAIKLLQLSNIELTQYVEQELQRNPLLERDDGDALGAESVTPEETGGAGTTGLETVDRAISDDSGGAGEAALDVDYDNLFDGEGPGGDEPVAAAGLGDAQSWSGRGGSFDDGEASLENTLTGVPTLREHLASQLSIDVTDPVDRIIGAHLIEMLDEAGYFIGDMYAVAMALNCNVQRVEDTLDRMQHFDPPGIFARSLSECLALQLRERNRLDPAMQTLLDNLDLVARHDLAALMRICGVDAEDIADILAEIRALNPKPALVFDHTVAQPVTPDVIMRPQSGGAWLVELNSETLPRVLVNNHYYARISRSARKKEDKQYIAECLQSANWLVKSLHQRATTILKVATEIIRQQDAFFVNGVQSLRPLVLRDIAQAIEMHESTVSRVTSNKFIATPRGIFELKYFFTQALGSVDGTDSHSAESVRHRIRALIDDESAKTVLSDDRIVAILQDEGVDIARRTVAKYRESMGISSSVQRRREKSVGL